MRCPFDLRKPGGSLSVVRQLQHLYVPGKAAHLLGPKRYHQMEAGVIGFFLNPPFQTDLDDLDPEFIGFHVHEKGQINQQQQLKTLQPTNQEAH